MRYRKNINFALFDTVDDAIGKSVYNTASGIVFYDRPSEWVTDNILNGSKHLGGKIITKSGFAFFVIINSLAEFVACFGMK